MRSAADFVGLDSALAAGTNLLLRGGTGGAKGSVAGNVLAKVAVMSSPFRKSGLQYMPRVVFDTEQYDSIEEEGFLDVTRHPLSTFSIDVDTASY